MKFNDFKITEYGPHSRYAKVGNTTMRANTRTGKVSANTKAGNLDLYVDNTLNKDGSQGRGTATYTKDKLKIKHDTRKGASASYKNADGTTMSASDDGKGNKKFKVSEDGRIVKGINTTADVGTDEIKKQAAKFGNSVDKDGRPPTLSKKVKGKSTNVLFNLGLAEGNRQSNLIDFINFCKDQLSLKSSPPIKFVSDTEDTTFGYFDNDTKGIVIQNTGRHQMDVMRTVAHELVHYKQDQTYDRELNGEDGSPDENQANALAGVILRRWGQKNPTLFTESVDENTQSSVYFTNMQEQLGEIAKTTEIYVDMDGVLADFFGEWTRLMNVDHWSKIDNDGLPQALQKIRDTDEFWLRLPILPQAKELLTLIKNIKGEYNICSSPLQDDPNSEPHKREWIKKNLSFFPPKNIYITHNKPQYAKNKDGTPNILIDDFGRNVKQWEDAGGIGFKYKDHKFERTAKQLQKHIAEEKMSKSDIKSAHKKADKLKDKPKAKKSISNWAKEKGMDPEGAIYAIAMNQQKKKASESYTRSELPQITKKHLKTFPHKLEAIRLDKIIPIQKERLKENYIKQIKNIQKGNYNPIIVDSENKIINGHHRYDVIKKIGMQEITVAKLPITLEQLLEKLVNKNLKLPNLKEALDNPYPISWDYLRPVDGSSAKAKLDDGSMLDINISDAGYGSYDIEFSRGRTMKPTGGGDEFRVFATVKAAITEWWNQLNKGQVKEIYFSASKADGGRGKLYKRFVSQWADKVGWEFDSNLSGDTETYGITNPQFDNVSENFADGKKFVEPNFSSEWDEAARYPEFVAIGKEAWIELASKGKAVTIKSAKSINNTDAADPDSFKELDPAKQKRALAQLEKGTIEMPIVAIYSDGHKELIGGNTRLTAMMAKDDQATVWAFKVPDEVAELAENFADGKVKGKSRPGRVKRSGASCNGSVTALRKRAKNASGEKAKMYHWCANMKSGKKKK